MFKSKKIKTILMIIIFGVIVFTMPNFSKASEEEPNGKISTHTRQYQYVDNEGKVRKDSKSYLISTTPEGPACTSETDWEFHINLTNFKVYVYHKESGKWKHYATKRLCSRKN